MRLVEFDGTPSKLNKLTPSVNDIMDKHGVGYKYVMAQLQKGIQVELEHTSDITTAKEIALDHLGERPDYYEQLAKIEEHKKGRKAIKYNKKPKKFIEPIKPQGATAEDLFTPLELAVMEGGHSLESNQLDEGWKDWVAGAGLAAVAAGGGSAAWDAYKSKETPVEKPAVVQQVKKDVKKSQEIAPNAVPKQSVTGSPHERFLTQAAVSAGIKGTELAQFLAQTAHESDNFKAMSEYGDANYFKKYEPKFLKDKKTKKFILDPETKKPKNFNPKAARLGNTMPGDGVKYKGRGYIQLTGKDNYTRAGKALGIDLVNNPQLVEKPEIAAKVAVWFWQNRVQPKVTDFANTKAATKPINPGLKGLEKRHDKFQDFKVAMR